MKRWCFVLTLVACQGGVEDLRPEARVELSREPDGRLAVSLRGLEVAPRAAEIELRVTATQSYELSARPDPAYDALRVAMNGLGAGTLFVADKRGALLSRDGVIARFEARPTGAADPDARIEIVRALVVAPGGAPVPIALGPGLSLR